MGDSRIHTAQTALQAAGQALETAHRAAELDVRQKYQNLQTAQAAIAAARAAVNTTNQSLRTGSWLCKAW